MRNRHHAAPYPKTFAGMLPPAPASGECGSITSSKGKSWSGFRVPHGCCRCGQQVCEVSLWRDVGFPKVHNRHSRTLPLLNMTWGYRQFCARLLAFEKKVRPGGREGFGWHRSTSVRSDCRPVQAPARADERPGMFQMRPRSSRTITITITRPTPPVGA